MSLEANTFLYETLLREVRRRAATDGFDLLPLLEETTEAAHWEHAGRFADGALENIALRLGQRLVGSDTAAAPARAARPGELTRTLHVASGLGSVGGHSRVLTKWIQRDLSSSHAIVLTRQAKPPPDFLAKIWADRAAPVIQLDPSTSRTARALRLREIAAGFDRVILHQHPDDSIPVLAFAQPGGCPVAMFNHAHYWFSLGSTVSDVIINTMPFFRSLTQRFRFPRHTALLHGWGELEPLVWSDIDKPAAKKLLGLAADTPVALTIAQEHYFKPMDGYDFFRTAEKLLARKHDLILLVVGMPENSELVPAHLRRHARLRLLGPVTDPRHYYRAADISLESFPMPSLGAFGETVTFGEAFPVHVYGPGDNILRTTQALLAKHCVRPKTEAEYLDYICALLTAGSAIREKAADLRRTIIAEDARFGDQFTALYRQIDALPHLPREIPATECCREPDNHILAALGDARLGRHFDRLLPTSRACLAHARAARRGHVPPHEAAARIGRGLVRAIVKR